MCRDTGGAYNGGGIILCVATQEGVYPSHEGYTPLCVATQGGGSTEGVYGFSVGFSVGLAWVWRGKLSVDLAWT